MALNDDVGANAEGEKADGERREHSLVQAPELLLTGDGALLEGDAAVGHSPVFGQMLSLQVADLFEQRCTTLAGRHTCPNVTTRPKTDTTGLPGSKPGLQGNPDTWARFRDSGTGLGSKSIDTGANHEDLFRPPCLHGRLRHRYHPARLLHGQLREHVTFGFTLSATATTRMRRARRLARRRGRDSCGDRSLRSLRSSEPAALCRVDCLVSCGVVQLAFVRSNPPRCS